MLQQVVDDLILLYTFISGLKLAHQQPAKMTIRSTAPNGPLQANATAIRDICLLAAVKAVVCVVRIIPFSYRKIKV